MRPLLAAVAVLAIVVPHVWVHPGGATLTLLGRPVYTWGPPYPLIERTTP